MLLGCLVRWVCGKKIGESECFFLKPTKMFSPKIREKTWVLAKTKFAQH